MVNVNKFRVLLYFKCIIMCAYVVHTCFSHTFFKTRPFFILCFKIFLNKNGIHSDRYSKCFWRRNTGILPPCIISIAKQCIESGYHIKNCGKHISNDKFLFNFCNTDWEIHLTIGDFVLCHLPIMFCNQTSGVTYVFLFV